MGQKHDGRRISSPSIKTKNKKNQTSKNKIQKALEKKATLKCSQIINLLKNHDQFIGCFASDRLDKLVIQQLPVFLLVNVDSHSSGGSHWIALGIFSDIIEIFDPLGFKFYNWKTVPCLLLKFIHAQSTNRKIKSARQIQPNESILCTYYCLIYVYLRKKVPFDTIISFFSKKIDKNDKKLEFIIKKYF